MLHGGFPVGRSTVIIGGPGSGKTILGMQFLYNGATQFNEPGIFVSFEESRAALEANCERFGWHLERTNGKPLNIVEARMPNDVVRAGDFDLSGLIAIIGDMVAAIHAKRIVIDGLDAVFGAAGDEIRNRELQRLLEWLGAQDISALITVKPGVEEHDSFPLRFEPVEYFADAVLRLSFRLNERLMQRMLRVVKIRGGDFAAGDHACLISKHGFTVAYTDLEKSVPHLSKRRVSTGVERLDRMLSGGFREGSVTLISGLPGTSKTTLAGSFLAATLARGERALLIALDEPAEQIMADLTSVNIHLEPFTRSGRLLTASYNAASAIGDEHLLAIERLVDEHKPSAIMIDPITALQKAGGSDIADLVSDRLANALKSRGVTAVFTAVGDSHLGEIESASARISTVADTWIHLSYAVMGGERNRTLTVIKSRGTGHSNQMRELILSDDGLTLEDVYHVGGDVLLGTARLQREQQDVAERAARESDLVVQLQEIDAQRAAAVARLNESQREINALDERFTLVSKSAAVVDLADAENRIAVLDNRHADPLEAVADGRNPHHA